MIGPDAARYLLAGQGQRVARPFNMRWLLPLLCRDDPKRWMAVWLCSWPLVAAGAVWWALGTGVDVWQAVAAAAILVALPGILGPAAVRPVGVDLPALAVGLFAAGCFARGWWPAALVLALAAGSIKESYPLWIALWAWNPLALVALVGPVAVYLIRRPAMDEVTAIAQLREIHDHPFRSSLAHHRGRWRDAWLMVAPWGVGLAALVAPSPQLVATVGLAYAQLVGVTDTVRVYQFAAGPVVALAAAQVVPPQWLLLAVVLHVVWWRKPEFV